MHVCASITSSPSLLSPPHFKLYDGSSSRIVATDPDVPSTQVVYQLAGNAQNYFYINATTGAMFVKQGKKLTMGGASCTHGRGIVYPWEGQNKYLILGIKIN